MGGLVLAVVTMAGCGDDAAETGDRPAGSEPPEAPRSWVYQLDGYPDGRLDELAEAPQDLAVIDLARDGTTYFTADDVAALRDSGKTVLAYVSIGTIETYRPEDADVRELRLNNWPDWPDEYFVRYWDEDWWSIVVQPRIDQALAAGFDGVYLDTLLAYEEIDLALVPDEYRDSLAWRMSDLVVRISQHVKEQRPGFLVYPQNNPELREYPGFVEAIDGIGMEELFFLDADEPCEEDWCAENLARVRVLRDAGKDVLAVDYADDPDNIAAACERYAEEGFAGYVADAGLDGIRPPCD